MFRLPNEIEEHLHKALEDLSTSSLHPIEKAARIWLNIVRIHPFNGAHKRIGKAIASRILLEHGYLPPLLISSDYQLYKQTLIDSLDPRQGDELFTQFVTRMVKRAQDAHTGQTL